MEGSSLSDDPLSSARDAEVRRWLGYSREDLEAARRLLADASGPPRHACWLASQSAEKAIKALLIVAGIDFPKTHDLDRLRTLLPDGFAAKADPPDLAELSEWAVESRYPGSWPDPTPVDAACAVDDAARVAHVVRIDLVSLGWPHTAQDP